MDDEPITASDFFQKGVKYLQQQRYDKALECVNNAIARNYFGADIALVKGEVLFELQRFDDSIEWFGRAVELDSSLEAEATLWKGRVYFEKQQLGRALSAFNRAINLSPMPGEAFLHKGMVLCERGDHLKALEALEKARGFIGDTDDKLGEILFWKGRALRGLKRNSEAAAQLEEVIEISPSFIEGYIELGELYRMQGWLEKSCEVYERGLKLHPSDPSLCNDYGNALRDLGRVEKSLAQLNRAVQLDGETSVAVFNRALTYERLSRLDDALEDYAKVVSHNPDDTDARFRRLDILSRQEKFDSAFKEVEDLRKLDVSAPEIAEAEARFLNRYVRSLEAKGEAPAVLGIYRKLLELHPDYLDFDNPGKRFSTSIERQQTILKLLDEIVDSDPDVDLLPLLRVLLLLKLGKRESALALLDQAQGGPFPEVAALLLADLSYYDLQAPVAALEAVNQALSIRPEFVAALWLKVSIQYEGLDDIAGAIDSYKAILKISPDNPAVLHALGELFLEAGEPQSALACYRRLLGAMPGDVAIQRELAQCYLALGRIGEAIKEIERLIDENKGVLDLRVDLAEALIRGGNRAKAETILEEILEENNSLNPSLDESCYELKAAILNHRREHQAALNALGRITLEELSSLGLLHKGIALAALGQESEAQTHLEELRNDYTQQTREGRRARIELAKLKRRHGDSAEAASLIGEALEGAPYNWRTRALLVWVLQEVGDIKGAQENENLMGFHRELEPGMRFMTNEEYEDAIGEFRQLTVLFPDVGVACYWLAAAQCMSGQYQGATKSLRHAISLAPHLENRARLDPYFKEFAFSELNSPE